MKCLSLRQPWATLVVRGAKWVETRSWRTGHRGLLAIHAAKVFPPVARSLCWDEPFRTLLQQGGYHSWDQLPLGQILGTVTLTDCVATEEIDPALTAMGHPNPDLEKALGDFRPRRWGWLLGNARPLIVPVACNGNLGLFDVPLRLDELTGDQS
jgi:hypothetical protein